MSFVSLNTRKPMNLDQSKIQATAMKTKKAVQETAERFQKLDGVEGADVTPAGDNVVLIPSGGSANLPDTLTDKVGKKVAKQFDLDVNPTKAEGTSVGAEDGLKTANIKTQTGDKSESFGFQKLDDGSEVYHGPVDGGGYMVVRENRDNGTLFVASGEEPMDSVFREATSPSFQAPRAVNDPENPEKKTFKEALTDAAQSQTTSFQGSYKDGFEQRKELLGNLAEAGSEKLGETWNSFTSWLGGGKKKGGEKAEKG